MNGMEMKSFMEKVRITHPNFTFEEYASTRIMSALGGSGKLGKRIFEAAKQAGILTGDEQSRWDRSRPLVNWMLKNVRHVKDPEVVVAGITAKDLSQCHRYLEKEIPYFYPENQNIWQVSTPSVFFRMADGDVRVCTNVAPDIKHMMLDCMPVYFTAPPEEHAGKNFITMTQDIDTFMRWLKPERLKEALFL
jgi:hypothetical protein